MSRALPSFAAAPAILFVTATRIGDAVLSTGLIHHLVRTYPGCRLTIAAGPVAAPLFRGVPGLVDLIPVQKRRYAGHWLALYRRIALRRWDLVVDLRGSALAWLLLAGTRRTAGKGEPDEHKLVQLSRLFGLAHPPAPHLWTLPSHDAAALRLIPPGPPVLAIGPTANWPGKVWRAERFAELIARLTGPGGPFLGARVAVFAAPHERALAEPVLQSIAPDRRIDMTGEADLLTIAAALRRATLFIGNDTGLMHMSAAVQTPTLGLFGPSPAAIYGPWGPHSAIAQTALSYRQLVDAPDFDHRRTGTLMDSLSVDTVEAAALSLVSRLNVAA